MKKVSVSELIQYYQCQRAWYLQRILKIKGAPFLPFAIGSAVHQFIPNYLHRGTKDGRTFFYKEQEPAIKTFRRFWLQDIWPQYEDEFDKETKWTALKKAEKNIRNYMDMAKDKGLPLNMEMKLSLSVQELGCTLIGTVDQIRPSNPIWAKKVGIEKPGIVLIDLKTGKPQYQENGTNKDIQNQMSILNNIQATMYNFLYKSVEEKSPDAFVFWFLGGDRPEIVATFRDTSDEKEMFNVVTDFMNGITTKHDINDYPRTPDTYKCKNCQYWKTCWENGNKPHLSTFAGSNGIEHPSGRSRSKIPNLNPKQQTFKLKGTRKRKLDEKEKEQKILERYEELMRNKTS